MKTKPKRKIKPKKPKAVLPCPKCGKDADQNSYRGTEFVGYFCRNNMGATGCGHHWEIKATPSVSAYLKARTREMCRHSTAIHKTWHAFCKEFGSDEGHCAWKLKGFEFMEAVEEWVKTHPEVQIVGVDDDHHSSSSLVLVPHFDTHRKDYWGTSVVYIPQCSGGEAVTFFLYPGHLEGLMDGFKALRMFMMANGVRRGLP